MQLSEEDIREFKEAFERDFHESITDAEARKLAGNLLRLVQAVVQDISDNRRIP